MNSGILAAGLRLLGMAGRFVLLLLIGRTMSAEELGVYGLFAATAGLLTQFVGLELHQPAVRELLRRSPPDRESIVRAQLRTYLLAYLALPVAIAIACATGLISVAHSVLLGLVIIGSHLSLESQRLLIAAGRTELAFLVLSLAQGLWVFPLAIAMWFVPGLRSLDVVLGTWSAAALIAAAIGLYSLRSANLLTTRAAGRADMAFVRSAWASARIFMASSLVFLLIESIDRYALQHFNGHAAVGVYTLYAGVARALREVAFAAIVARVLPQLVTASQRHEPAAARAAVRLIARRLVAFVGVAAPLIAVGLLGVLPFLNNPLYGAHLLAFGVLLVSAVVGTMTLVPHYALYAAGHEAAILRTHVITLLATLAGLVLLVPRFGVDGAALASLLAALLMLVLKWSAARRLDDGSAV